jgi:hypothetical protein
MKYCWLVVMCYFDEKKEWKWNKGVQHENQRIIIHEDEFSISTNLNTSLSTTHTTSNTSSSSTSIPISSPNSPRNVKSLNEIYGYFVSGI